MLERLLCECVLKAKITHTHTHNKDEEGFLFHFAVKDPRKSGDFTLALTIRDSGRPRIMKAILMMTITDQVNTSYTLNWQKRIKIYIYIENSLSLFNLLLIA